MHDRRDDPSGTSEMRAFGEELLATGARYIEAGRRWLSERREAQAGSPRSTRADGQTHPRPVREGPGAAQATRGRTPGHLRDDDERRDWVGHQPDDGYNSVDHLGGAPDFGHFGAYDSEGRVGRVQHPHAPRSGGWRGVGPQGYTRPDARITEDLCEQLLQDDAIDPREISVQVRDGIVTLEGRVDQRWVKHRVEDMAERCAGVRDVDNRLRVRGAGVDADVAGATSGAASPAQAGDSARDASVRAASNTGHAETGAPAPSPTPAASASAQAASGAARGTRSAPSSESARGGDAGAV